MKKKVLISILVLSLSASFAGCQTSSQAEEPAANPSQRTENQHTTDTQTDTNTNVTAPNGAVTNTDTETDTVVEDSNSLISSDDIKELEAEEASAADTDTDTNNKAALPEPSSIDVGGITLEAELIPFDNALELSDMESIDSTIFGDTLYILDNKTLRTYTVTDNSAVKGDEIKLDTTYERVDADVFGNIYLSNKRFNAAMLNDDGTLTELDLTGKLAMSKVMSFGLTCSGKDTIQKYSDGDIEEWILNNIEDDESSPFTKISDIEFVRNHILVGGNFNDGDDTLRIAVYDYDGNEIALTDNKISGSGITSMTETDNGIVAASGSSLSLWNSYGSEIGQTKSSESTRLFGTENPTWINDVFASDDGTVLALCTTEKNNGKTEAFLYRIWGF